MQAVMEPAIAAGAAAFVGVLKDYPGDSFNYYVPYDAIQRPIPGVWVNASAGARLAELLAAGPVSARLTVDARSESATTYNIVGELAGADEEAVIIGSHHDGPWASAVEDASGMALVLARATYWSRVPAEERPHRLVFLVNSGHMYGGAGVHAFIDRHRAELDQVVLEVHLEHAAAEFAERDGILTATGEPEPRWWFTSRIPALEGVVREAIEQEDLQRSMILRPDIFAPYPTTDGGPFHAEGVPLVNYLTAPFYLFDAMDTLDKIHRPSLVPVTRAACRIVDSTMGVSTAQIRSSVQAVSA
jgi:Peptidase family M28